MLVISGVSMVIAAAYYCLCLFPMRGRKICEVLSGRVVVVVEVSDHMAWEAISRFTVDWVGESAWCSVNCKMPDHDS